MKLLEGGPVHHAGFLEAWMDSVSFDRGQFFLVSFVGSDANGALNIAFQPHEMPLTSLSHVGCSSGERLRLVPRA